MKCICSLGLLLVIKWGYSQNTVSFKQSLYYQINEVRSVDNNLRLDSILRLVGDSALVYITGYADFLGTTETNLKLSKNRAAVVKDYLLVKGKSSHINVISCKGVGDKDSHGTNSIDGEPDQRRVDVLFGFPTRKAVSTSPIITYREKQSVEKTKSNTGSATTTTVVSLEKLASNETLVLEGLWFIPGRHIWLKSSVPVLESLLRNLQEFPTMKIEIQGHICCSFGTKDVIDQDTNEKKLSENRARAVYDYLVENEIDPTRLIYKGYGHSQPKVAIELNDIHEQMNRRVEIKVLEK